MSESGISQGWVPELASDDDLRRELERAFDYRGDIHVTRKDGAIVEGYIFDRQAGPTLAASFIRIIAIPGNEKVKIPYSDVARIAFSGKDSAAGKSWEAWVRKYGEKKAAGEKNIGLMPEELD